ncbi:MAG: hypothetical protein LJF15_08240 [Acidobacteria bacterium]|nr:hypothetical protein [Acidobacteriota bacterium]
MDSISDRAVADYHALVRDDEALAQELEERFFARMRERDLTFGGRMLCSFARPNLVSPAVYGQIGDVCRGIFRAIEKVEAALGTELWDRVDMRPEERELAGLDSGYRRSSPLARLDSFVTPSSYQYVELNAETPAGSSYADRLAEVFLEMPVVRRFQERWRLRPFHTGRRLLATLIGCYREAQGQEEHPAIAVVDYDDVPTRVEHHMAREYFESQGYPTLVCDPRHLAYERGRLSHEGSRIDIVYKRLLVNELLERRDEVRPLLDAARERAVVIVNPFRCKPLHKKAIFAVLTDDAMQGLFSGDERSAIRAHVPWTRRVTEGRATRHGEEVDLPAFVLAHRERLVMKPNDEYGGKGVFIGWEMTDAEWARALAEALASSYVVQERVDVLRQEFPEIIADEGSDRGRLRFGEFVVDLDPYVFGGEVEGFLTRLSATSLANVTSGAGQVPSLLVEPRP